MDLHQMRYPLQCHQVMSKQSNQPTIGTSSLCDIIHDGFNPKIF